MLYICCYKYVSDFLHRAKQNGAKFTDMKHEKIYKEVEMICRKERIMEKHYGVEKFNDGEPYFTTSQETDIREMISDGLEIEEIISTIRKW